MGASCRGAEARRVVFLPFAFLVEVRDFVVPVFDAVVLADVLVAAETVCVRFLVVFFLAGVAALARQAKAQSDTAAKIAFFTKSHFT